MNTKEQASAKKGQGAMKAATAKKPQAKAPTANAFAGAGLMLGAGNAMGAGIDALFSETELPEFTVNLDDVEIVGQVREEFENEEQGLAELGASLAKMQIQAIFLRVMPSGHPKPFRLVAGERRVRAARLQGLSTLRAKAKELTDEEAEDLQFAENTHRKNLTQIEEAKKVTDKPTLICTKTIIGWGSPNKSGSHDCHGSALGEAEVAAAREYMGWKHEPFVIPQDVYEGWDARTKGQGHETLWNNKFAEYAKAYPAEAAEFKRRMAGDLPANWKEATTAFIKATNEKAEGVATRKASQNAINALAAVLPEFVGGSADLTGSNLTNWTGAHHVHGKKPGNYISYGVREFGMAHIMNGMALHGGILPFGGTFHMFSDYMKSGIRMSALMHQRVVYVLTHDSIGQGEDGPTHQPVENTAGLRYIPRLDVWRPADSVETAIAWVAAVERNEGPAALVLSRQNVPGIKHDEAQFELVRKGGYVFSDVAGKPDVIIIANGSELDLAIKAAAELNAAGTKARVVSMPSTNVFDRQDQAYKESVLVPGVKRVAVEAAHPDFWRKYVGIEGAVVGIDTFGESAPGGALFKHFGFTVENVVNTVKSVL